MISKFLLKKHEYVEFTKNKMSFHHHYNSLNGKTDETKQIHGPNVINTSKKQTHTHTHTQRLIYT
jgi:hypothetical protein